MGKFLVIVESPAKARTVGRFLGPDFVVAPSIGHVRDLPENAADIPARLKGQAWARLGVNVDGDFEPLYVVPATKREQVRKLKALMDDATVVYLATDEDREGESISWHLLQVLQPKVPVHRMVFHEITSEAIARALENPRDLDESLVRAQETRRILDRLFGYEVSPLLWRKIRPKLSAGRVQSVAVRLVVERERLRIAFNSASYWGIKASISVKDGEFLAQLATVGNKSVASRADFDPDTGALKTRSRKVHLDEAGAQAIERRLAGAQGHIAEVDEKDFTESPPAPFITSTLQQEANRKLRWGARRTMQVAQRLYENGWITYMRTDSTTLSQEAIRAARGIIERDYGAEYLPAKPRKHRSNSRMAQEAHEAIRPAGAQFRTLAQAGTELESDEARLYELILRRTLACQMVSAVGHRVRVTIAVDDTTFQASGRQIVFPGFRRAYVEGSDDGNGRGEASSILPPMSQGDGAIVLGLEAQEHNTQPPARLTEATLVRELEAKGIGRPSTYATIIDTIQERGYVFKRANALVPTFTAFSVTDLLGATLSDLVDYTFTARMEDELDEIALGKLEPLAYLRGFYQGPKSSGSGLKDRVVKALETVDARAICSFPVGPSAEDAEFFVRVGRYGAYLVKDETRVDLPDDLPPDELDITRARAMVEEQEQWPKLLGVDPASGEDVLIMKGPYGPYVQLGLPPEEPAKGKGKKGKKAKAPKPKRASLLKGMSPLALELDTALALLALPRELGPHPESGEPVTASNGRYGPYLKCGTNTRSLPEPLRVLDIQLDEAVALLAAPNQRRGGASTPARSLGEHPESGASIQLKGGRYGPYVTDGSVNASLPKGTDAESFTLERALELLAKKASSPRAKRRKPAKRKK
jgi:DNA topoisomerase-1